MPIIPNPTKLEKLKEKQPNCKLCEEEGSYNKHVALCDICSNWVCLDCSDITEELYQQVEKSRIKVNFVCNNCEEELPKIREMIKLNQKQQQLEVDIVTMKSVIEDNKTAQDNTNEDFNKRLLAVEKVMKEKELADVDYPPLTALTAQAKTLNKVVAEQKKLDTRVKIQKDTLEEEKRREDKENSLIMYGVLETEEEKEDQMREDFLTVRKLYTNKVDIQMRDLINITRLGKEEEKNDKIRPIKMTFVSRERRLEILRNNKNLRLEGENYQVCSSEFCDNQGSKHTHIYVSPDKTKQQRDEEKKLREELKRRKPEEPNLIIRNGKLIEKKPTHARWTQIIDNWS